MHIISEAMSSGYSQQKHKIEVVNDIKVLLFPAIDCINFLRYYNRICHAPNKVSCEYLYLLIFSISLQSCHDDISCLLEQFALAVRP